MAKYEDVADETREVFKNILADRDLERIITVDIVNDKKLKHWLEEWLWQLL